MIQSEQIYEREQTVFRFGTSSPLLTSRDSFVLQHINEGNTLYTIHFIFLFLLQKKKERSEIEIKLRLHFMYTYLHSPCINSDHDETKSGLKEYLKIIQECQKVGIKKNASFFLLQICIDLMSVIVEWLICQKILLEAFCNTNHFSII